MLSEIRSIKRSIEVIETAITGDSKLGIEGIVKRQNKMELQVADLVEWKRRFTYNFVKGAVMLNGLVFGIIEGTIKVLEMLHHAKP